MLLRKTTFAALLAVLMTTFVSVAEAQRKPIGQNIFVEPKDGQVTEWEAAYKEHLAWHGEMNDDWGWTTYQMLSGPRAGQYLIRTGNHDWSDFDARGDMMLKDQADALSKTGKYTKSRYVWYDRTHWNLSRIPDGGGPYKVVQFTRVFVKSGMVAEFFNVVGKYHAAFEKTNSPDVYATAQTQSGGSLTDFLFVGLHEGFAGLDEPPEAMAEMMVEVYGPMEAAAINEEFEACVDRMEAYTAVLREDLSYRPGDTTSNE